MLAVPLPPTILAIVVVYAANPFERLSRTALHAEPPIIIVLPVGRHVGHDVPSVYREIHWVGRRGEAQNRAEEYGCQQRPGEAVMYRGKRK